MITRNRSYSGNNLVHRQRGAIAITAAVIFIPLFLFLVLVVDTGRLFIQKRATQTDADLAALETAVLYCRDQSMDASERRAAAVNVLSQSRNDFKGLDGDIAVSLGKVERVSDGEGGIVKQFVEDASGHAIQVTLNYTVPASIFSQIAPTGARTITFVRTSVAQACQPVAQLSVRSDLVTIDSDQSDLLNAVIGDILGGSLNLSVASWQGLLDTSINLLDFLDALALDLGLTAGDYDGVLSTSLSVGSLLEVAIDVLNNAGASAIADSVEDIENLVPGGLADVSLGDLLNVAEDLPSSALDVPVNVLNLVQGAIQLGNGSNAVAIDQAINVLGITNGKVSVKVIEPPQFTSLGNPDFDNISASTSQADVFISLSTNLLGGLGLGSISPLTSQVDVIVEAAKATSTIENGSQTCDGGPTSINSTTNTSAARIQIGKIGSTPEQAQANFESGSYTLDYAPIANVTLLGIPIIRLDLRATTDIASGTTSITHEQDPSEEYLPEIEDGIGENAYTSTGTNLGGVLGLDLDVNPVVLGVLPLGFLLNPILDAVLGVLDGVLSALLTPLLNPLLNSLGVSLAGAEVGAALTCETGKVSLEI